MPQLPITRLALAAGFTCVCIVPAGSAAAAEDAVPELVYSCIADSSLASASTKVTFAPTGLPASVTAGETLSVQGTLGISVSNAHTLLSKFQGAKQINVESSTFNLQVTLGGETSRLTAEEAVGSPVKFASPTTVSAGVTFPGLAVPADAAGVLVLSLPVEAGVKHSVPNAPAQVAFTTVLNQDALFAPERQLDCTAPQGAERVVVARIPITAAPVVPEPEPTPVVPVPEPTPVALPSTPEVAEPPPLEETPAPQPPVLTEAAPQLAPANAPIPPRTTGRGTFVPTWSLVLSGALVPAAAVYLAAHQRQQLQQLVNARRLQEEGTPR